MTLALAFVAVFASLLMPALYSGAILVQAGFLISYRGIRVSPKLPDGSGSILMLFLVFAGLAVLGPILSYGVGWGNLDALKFLFATASLAIGLMLGVEKDDLSRAIPIFLGVMTAIYAGLYFTDAQLSQEALLYPPDNNHSASMLAVFLPLIVMRMKRGVRLFCFALLFAFAIFVASRSLLALTLIASALSFEKVRKQRFLIMVTVALALAVLFLRTFSLDNFSDRLRLQIIEVSLHFVQTRGAYAFNFGEAAFADFLNIYPIYQRLEIQHAHNLLLQVWAAYGYVPLFAFILFLTAFGTLGWRQRNYLFLFSFMIFLAIGMMEAIITDIRAFGTIMFALGYTYSRGTQFGTADIETSVPEIDDGMKFHASAAPDRR
ncbi:O-antigen ligase family protein [Qipengyuania sp. ASV99]|uniref:O-antigen ligase family protein n=1 Tax=Qipengyuania sp. ASV99 TaxID=3399681 RepID=UPI003A4C5F35